MNSDKTLFWPKSWPVYALVNVDPRRGGGSVGPWGSDSPFKTTQGTLTHNLEPTPMMCDIGTFVENLFSATLVTNWYRLYNFFTFTSANDPGNFRTFWHKFFITPTGFWQRIFVPIRIPGVRLPPPGSTLTSALHSYF